MHVDNKKVFHLSAQLQLSNVISDIAGENTMHERLSTHFHYKSLHCPQAVVSNPVKSTTVNDSIIGAFEHPSNFVNAGEDKHHSRCSL